MFNPFRGVTVLLSLLLMGLLACSQNDGSKQSQEEATPTEEAVAADPGDAAGVQVATWNKFCPIRGGKVSAEAPTVEYKGKVIGFCCPGCDENFMKDPDKFVKNLSEDGSEFLGG